MPDDNNNNNNGGDSNGNGNGSGETDIATNYEHVGDDVYIRTDADGSQDVAYSPEVNEAVDPDSSQDSGNGSSNGASSS